MLTTLTSSSQPSQQGECNAAWYVLRTRSRQEKAIARDLAALDVHHFLPLKRQVRYHGSRKACVLEPLLPGYVFLYGAKDDAYRVDRLGRVAQILDVVNQEQLDWELENLRAALELDATLSSYPHLVKGRRVEVMAGPFKGVQGVIEDVSKNQLFIQITFAGRALSLDIDGSLLVPVD